MIKFNSKSSVHTTWESSYNPFDDHHYKFARDSRGVGMNGYFLPRDYFDSPTQYNDESKQSWLAISIAIILAVIFLTLS